MTSIFGFLDQTSSDPQTCISDSVFNTSTWMSTVNTSSSTKPKGNFWFPPHTQFQPLPSVNGNFIFPAVYDKIPWYVYPMHQEIWFYFQIYTESNHFSLLPLLSPWPKLTQNHVSPLLRTFWSPSLSLRLKVLILSTGYGITWHCLCYYSLLFTLFQLPMSFVIQTCQTHFCLRTLKLGVPSADNTLPWDTCIINPLTDCKSWLKCHFFKRCLFWSLYLILHYVSQSLVLLILSLLSFFFFFFSTALTTFWHTK